MEKGMKGHDAQGHDVHSRVSEKPAGKVGRGSEAGSLTHGDVKGAQEGGSRAEALGGKASLGHAVKELERQHPHHHSAGGIHGTKDHIRHEPMHKGR